METVCYTLCFLSACFALLVGSCHGSIQGLQQNTSDISDWNNVSEINYESIMDSNIVTEITNPKLDKVNKVVALNISDDEDNSLRSEGKITTTPLSKEIVTFPIFDKTTKSDRSSVLSATEIYNSRENNSGESTATDKQYFSVTEIKNELISNISRPKLDSLVPTSSEFSASSNSNVTEYPNKNYQNKNEFQDNADQFTYPQYKESNENENASDYDSPCNEYLSVVITEYELFDNGSILATDNYPIMYPPEYIWEDIDQNNDTILRGCLCLLTNCLRKCCPENMTHTQEGCVPNNSHSQLFKPQFINMETLEVLKNNSNDIRTVYGNPCEHGSYRIDPLDQEFPEPFWLTPDGILSTAEGNFTPAEYCMEIFEDVGRTLPLLCFPADEEPASSTEETNVYMMYPIGMIISLPFLLATFFIYACFPELRNLHGKSLMCHVISLFSAYVFLVIVQLGSDKLEMAFCKISAFVIFFAFHASFFWLNVMCFDIWWTFSGLRPLRGSVKEREYKKFVMYSIYAWGSPLIMLVVCLLMDLIPEIPDDYIKPEFGKAKCWFRTRTADLAYFFGPIGIIVLCNIILFIATAIKLVHLKKETKMLKGGESKRHDEESERQRFNLYLKLFIVMGVNWIMEVVSWAVGGPEYLWYITDLGNTLQGVLIFVIFVWKRKIRRLLAKKFCPKLASTSIYEGSIKSRPTASRTSSINNTYRTSLSTQETIVLKSLPNGAYRLSKVP